MNFYVKKRKKFFDGKNIMIYYDVKINVLYAVKKTEGVILSHSLCKDGNAWFTTIPLKCLSCQV